MSAKIEDEFGAVRHLAPLRGPKKSKKKSKKGARKGAASTAAATTESERVPDAEDSKLTDLIANVATQQEYVFNTFSFFHQYTI